MSNQVVKISFDVEPTGQALPLRVILDNQIVWENVVDQKHQLEINCDNSTEYTEHVIQFVLQGKDSSHTKIDDQGNIVEDSSLKFSNFFADELELTQLVVNLATYQHNFNGNGPETADRFYGVMGCNGTITLNFTTPFYLWMLENI